VGYKILNRKISNLIYIDDLKVYAKDATEMERCRALIAEFSDDIKMTFALEKCAVLNIKAGKLIDSPDVADIPILSAQDNYKYLGIVQCNEILHNQAKETAKKEFFQRTKSILKAEVTAKHTTDAIRTYAMPILRYGFGILKWTAVELRAIDRKVRKILTKGKFHHPKSNTHRLYLSRQRGGRGLIGAADCHRQECTALAIYLSKSTDPLTKIVRKNEEPKVHGIMAYLYAGKGGDVECIDKEHEKELRKMNLHGDYFRQQDKIATVNLPLSTEWLDIPYLRFETESLLCAAQEQALATNYVRAKIWKTHSCTKCRLCKTQNETVSHIVSGCKMLAATQYMFRHNQVAKYLHWNILRDLNINVSESWLKHDPKEAITAERGIKVLWDSYLLTDRKVAHNRPDIVIHNTTTQECLIIDVAIPVCQNIVKKEAEKLTKYRDLEIELQKCWHLKKVRTIPIIIGALGTIGSSLPKYLRDLSPNLKASVCQRTALLGSAHILRNFLTPYKTLSS
jgi:hypothetical protein